MQVCISARVCVRVRVCMFVSVSVSGEVVGLGAGKGY